MVSSEPSPTSRPDPDASLIRPRIPLGGRRELGLFGWLFCKLAARIWGVPQIHLFTTLGQHKRLFWSWAPFGGVLMRRGRLPQSDTELVILRVGHLRGCEYELQQHRRLAARRGIVADTQAKIFAGPPLDGLSERQRALMVGIDELIGTRTMTPASWQSLVGHLDRRQLIEFVTLVGQYDALAMTLNTLQVPLDYPD